MKAALNKEKTEKKKEASMVNTYWTSLCSYTDCVYSFIPA